MTNAEAKKLARQRLSPRRYRHTKNVAAAARELAQRYGADPARAELAGWLHDIVKECSREELLQLMERDAIIAGSTRQRAQPIWHGPCGAVYAKHALGVTDEGVLGAIGCHTTGKAGMSLLEKILFLADVISAERTHPGVERLRRLAREDLDAAVAAAMEENIAYLQRAGKPLDTDTVAALAALRAEGPRCRTARTPTEAQP